MNSKKLYFLLFQTSLLYRLLICDTVITSSIILSVIHDFSTNVMLFVNQSTEMTTSGLVLPDVITTSSTTSFDYSTKTNKCKYTSDCHFHSFCFTGYCFTVPTTTVIIVDSTAYRIDPLLWIIMIGVPSIFILGIVLAIAIYCRKSCKITFLCRRRRTVSQSECNNRVASGISTVEYSENARQEGTPPPLYNEVIIHSPIHASSSDHISLFVFKLPSYSSFIKNNPVEVTEII